MCQSYKYRGESLVITLTQIMSWERVVEVFEKVHLRCIVGRVETTAGSAGASCTSHTMQFAHKIGIVPPESSALEELFTP